MVDVSSRKQALDGRARFDPSVAPPVRNPSAQEPFVAQAGMSILKAASFQDEVVGTDCRDASVLGSEPRHCLYFGAVLTVLDAPPSDGTGAGFFRPGYTAGQRELIPVAAAGFDLLPRLPLSSVSGADRYSNRITRVQRQPPSRTPSRFPRRCAPKSSKLAGFRPQEQTCPA
jgi:hypothetical protein